MAPKKKVITEKLTWSDEKKCWTVHYGELTRAPGRPGKTESLFKIVAEKLPYASLKAIKKHIRNNHPDLGEQGVYVAHDSMGCPRYIGRGNIFTRLEVRQKLRPHELEYFSFYVLTDKKHEREVETLLIRAAGMLLEFNTQKRRVGIEPASIMDFEAGTLFYERQHKKGKKS